jgi:serine/threonine protein kinase/outer membrane protein OmpA-like peptidoglycan-associated protein
MEEVDARAILRVSVGASVGDIQAAYRRRVSQVRESFEKAKDWRTKTQLEREFAELEDAFNLLSQGDKGEELRLGRVFAGRFELERELSNDRTGAVWLAEDHALQRRVALKFLPDEVIRDQRTLEDLRKEINARIELKHPNIAPISALVEDKGRVAISKEYVDGPSLTQLRSRTQNQVLEVKDLETLVKELCSALDYLHQEAKLIHGGINPNCLIVDPAGSLQLTDLGLERLIGESLVPLTGRARAHETLVYNSPQQAASERLIIADDVYSLGATLYELLTSKPPFYTGDILFQIKEQTPPSMAQRRADLGIKGAPIPTNWEETVAACLAKEPAPRPQSSVEVARRLEKPDVEPVVLPVAGGKPASTSTKPESAPVGPVSAPIKPLPGSVPPVSTPAKVSLTPVEPVSTPIKPTLSPPGPASAPVGPSSGSTPPPASALAKPPSTPAAPASTPTKPPPPSVLPLSVPVKPPQAPVGWVPVAPGSTPTKPPPPSVPSLAAPVKPPRAPVGSAPGTPASTPSKPSPPIVSPLTGAVKPTQEPVGPVPVAPPSVSPLAAPGKPPQGPGGSVPVPPLSTPTKPAKPVQARAGSVGGPEGQFRALLRSRFSRKPALSIGGIILLLALALIVIFLWPHPAPGPEQAKHPTIASPSATAQPSPSASIEPPSPSASTEQPTPTPVVTASLEVSPTPSPKDTATPNQVLASPTPLTQPEINATREEVIKRINALPGRTEAEKTKLIEKMEKARSMERLTVIHFDIGQAVLHRAAADELVNIFERSEMRKKLGDPTIVLVVAGYADTGGGADINLSLSQERAESVTKILKRRVKLLNAIETIGMGATELLNDQRPDQNRAVEIWAVAPF